MKTKVFTVGLISLWLCACKAFAANLDFVLVLPNTDVYCTEGFALGVVPLNSSGVLIPFKCKNTGNVREAFSISIHNPVGWELVSTVPGIDQYRLFAIWHESANYVVASDEFQENDVLTISSQPSSDTKFFNDFETHSVNGTKGINVAPGESRYLFIKYESPTSLSAGKDKSVPVELIVTAIAQ